jgi:hypothetical protein
MKTIPAPWKMVTLLAITAAIVTAITYAQPKTSTPSQYGVRLIFGCNGNEPLHATRASLEAALTKLPSGEDQYNVEYKSNDPNRNMKKGKLKLVSCKEVDIGGAPPTPPPNAIAAGGGGVNVTQQVTFSSLGDLQAFTSALVVEP